jgi:dTDP-4-amino-4,6-dideoxygalactose transaminase
MTPSAIPFNRPYIAGKELFYIAQAVARGNLSGDGRFADACAELLETKFGIDTVMLTHSCTGALEMSAILAGIEPGDEVVMPSFTFVSTANAFVLRGAAPRFVDIRPDTLNMDEQLLEAAISEKTRVIVPVHYAGVGCEMDTIMEIAARHGLLVVEDAAQGVNSTYKGRYLGSIGHLGTYSFHETKNFTCGEGGALAVNAPEFRERAGTILKRGTNRNQFLQGTVDHYTWTDLGSSYLMSELLAAFLFAQLENMDRINQKRNEIWNFYHKALIPLANDGRLRLPYIPPSCESNAHLFYIVLADEATRDSLMRYLKDRKINAIFHYIPLHLSPVGRAMGYGDGRFPVTESMSGRLLRLPFYFDLTREDQETIVNHIFTFFNP